MNFCVYRFVLPPNLTLKNFEGLDLGKMDQSNDSGLASYVAGQIDRTLSWKVVKSVLAWKSLDFSAVFASFDSELWDIVRVTPIRMQDVKWLQSITSMPILVKGVITAEDGK